MLERPFPTAAERNAFRWTSRDSRSASPPAAARANRSLRVIGDGRTCQRFGPDDTPRQGVDQRLVQDVDLFLRNRCFEQQVASWSGGHGCP